MPIDDPKQRLRDAVRAAQERYETDSAATKEARRKAFAEAQAAGLSLREIGAVVKLNHARIKQIIDGK